MESESLIGRVLSGDFNFWKAKAVPLLTVGLLLTTVVAALHQTGRNVEEYRTNQESIVKVEKAEERDYAYNRAKEDNWYDVYGEYVEFN